MQTMIDEHGRLEIPRELRDRFHLSAGAVVNVEPIEDGLQITAVSQSAPATTEGKLIWDNGLLVYHRPGATITVQDVNEALELGRQERFNRIIYNEDRD